MMVQHPQPITVFVAQQHSILPTFQQKYDTIWQWIWHSVHYSLYLKMHLAITIYNRVLLCFNPARKKDRQMLDVKDTPITMPTKHGDNGIFSPTNYLFILLFIYIYIFLLLCFLHKALKQRNFNNESTAKYPVLIIFSLQKIT